MKRQIGVRAQQLHNALIPELGVFDHEDRARLIPAVAI